jgi:hypothetical protein
MAIPSEPIAIAAPMDPSGLRFTGRPSTTGTKSASPSAFVDG